jgi:predicted metalloprotease
MKTLIRPRLLIAAGLVLAAVIGVTQTSGTPAHAGDAQSLTVSGSQPDTMNDFLAAVTQDVDAYWTKVFAANELPEPRVNYRILEPGQSVDSACGTLDDSTAAYCPGDDTITIAERFANGIFTGGLDRALPGSSRGFGGTMGDFAVAYVVAHEYGHQIQDELGVFERNVPTVNTELQADCYAGNWAKSAYDENRLDDGDIEEALRAALAVGDFDFDSAGHHGTPEQREQAWTRGFESGDPSACSAYVAA